MDKGYIIAIDQGTTTTRVLAFSLSGTILCMAQKEFQQYYPKNGWVEHDGEEIWLKTLECLDAVIRQQDEKGRKALSIGITNQRETAIIWDRKSGKPVAPAIVWQDRRTADYCQKLKGHGHEEMIVEKTGLVLDSYFSATKFQWLLDDGALRPMAENGDILAGTIESYLVYRLTGGALHVSDRTNASRTMLCNIATGQWDNELLNLFSIPHSLLPDIVDNSGDFGAIKPGLPGAGVAITGIIGDQQSASIGQGCIKPGMIKSTYGTGCFVLQHTGSHRHFSENRLISTIAHSANGVISYALEGSIFNAGTVSQFLRDQMGFICHIDEIETLCSSVKDTNGVYMVPAFTGLGAPHWDADARGIITGLTRATNRAHIVRASMESIAYQTFDLLTAFTTDSGRRPDSIRVDGGMSTNNWLMQYLADVMNIDIERPENTETTAYGAAIVAGIGKGVWNSLEEACQTWRLERAFKPDTSSKNIKKQLGEWHRAIAASRQIKP